ncbi:MAG: serine protease [Sporichthyaceae bacterium]
MSSPRLFRRATFSAAATAAVACAAIFPGAGAHAAEPGDKLPKFAEFGLSSIHPGIPTLTKGDAACTANFIFLDAANNAYIGQAAHCSGKGAANDTNGCNTKSEPLGTKVLLGASGVKGKIVYSSWISMQKVGEKDEAACASNDFSLIRIPNSAIEKVNPSIPVFGGPTALRTTPLETGESVLSYGSSPLRAGITSLSPKQGFGVATSPEGWEHQVYTATPGVPGDSGSGFIDEKGQAFGVLSTLAIAPVPGSNGVADLARALEYAQKHSGIKGLRLAIGDKPFAPGAVPALGGISNGELSSLLPTGPRP